MQPAFNINRPPVSDEEIEKHKDFDALVQQFKKQSLKKARGDESWWKRKKVQYTTVILGVTVICTVTYQQIKSTRQSASNSKKHETITTPPSHIKKPVKRSPTVASKLPAINKKPAAYTVNNQKGGTITHPGSTRIKVPKGAFVDEKGAEIVGEVTLEYREFDHLGDIIAAGIPMRHDSLGAPYQLESAGMFEITANKDGKPVQIKPDLPLTVDLASRNAENRFNQYYLDTVSGNWRYLGPDPPRPVEQVAATLFQNPAPATPVSPSTDSLDRHYASLVQKLPVPAQPAAPVKHRAGRPTFVLDSEPAEFPELAAFSNVEFEVGSENKNYSPEMHDITWSDIRISEGPVKGKNYLLHLSQRNRREQLVVYPVLREEDYRKARAVYEEKLADYQHLVEEKQAREKQLLAQLEQKKKALAEEQAKRDAQRRQQLTLQAEAASRTGDPMSIAVKARRLFQIASFGIYNSDHPHPAPAPGLPPQFVAASTGEHIQAETIYVVDHARQTVMTGQPGNFMLPASRGTDYSVCVLSRGLVYVCGKSRFREVVEGGLNTFPMDLHESAADHMADFRKALEL